MAVPPTMTEPIRKRPEQPEQAYRLGSDERDVHGSSEDFFESEEEKRSSIGRESRFSTREEAAHSEEFITNRGKTSTDRRRRQKVLEHANSLADDLGMSREQFYLAALVEYMGKIENEKATRELNESYEGVDQSKELAVLNYLVSHYDPQLADE